LYIVALRKAQLFLNSWRQRQSKETVAWLDCKDTSHFGLLETTVTIHTLRKMNFIYNMEDSYKMFLKISSCPVNSLSTEFNKQSAVEKASESFYFFAGCLPSAAIFLTEVK